MDIETYLQEQLSSLLEYLRSFNAIERGIPDREKLTKLVEFLGLLQAWNQKMDLVSPAPPQALVDRHLIDSIAAWYLLRELEQWTSSRNLMDVGSGAGLPGIVFSIFEPDKNVVLVEPRSKRCQFLREAKRRLVLENVQIIEERMEDIPSLDIDGDSFSFCRALGRDEEFLRHSMRLLPPKSLFAILAGPNWKEPSSNPPLPHKQIKYAIPTGERILAVFHVKHL